MGAWNVEQELVHRAFDRLETSEGNMRQNKPSSQARPHAAQQARPLQQVQPVSKKHYQKGPGRQQQEQKAQIS
jgi:hypothetical protein